MNLVCGACESSITFVEIGDNGLLVGDSERIRPSEDCRLDFNDPPGGVKGCRLNFNNPPTSVRGIHRRSRGARVVGWTLTIRRLPSTGFGVNQEGRGESAGL